MCIFCKIIAKEIPSHIVYEDDQVLAILDISQVTKGHTLVMPKKHVADFSECDEVTAQQVMRVAHLLSNHILEKTKAAGMNVLTNIHEVAGQTVPHFHVHLIPRYSKQDALSIEFMESEAQDLEAVAKLIQY